MYVYKMTQIVAKGLYTREAICRDCFRATCSAEEFNKIDAECYFMTRCLTCGKGYDLAKRAIENAGKEMYPDVVDVCERCSSCWERHWTTIEAYQAICKKYYFNPLPCGSCYRDLIAIYYEDALDEAALLNRREDKIWDRNSDDDSDYYDADYYDDTYDKNGCADYDTYSADDYDGKYVNNNNNKYVYNAELPRVNNIIRF